MKNNFLKFMKKNILFLAIFLFGCQSITDKLKNNEVVLVKEPIIKKVSEPMTHNQFQSQTLPSDKINEKKIKVALFVPLSGKNKELGFSLFNSATLSLFDNDVNHNIELVLIDSKDTPKESVKAFKEIIDRKIKIVIGPVFSSAVEAIAQDVIDNKITVISLSNNQELAGKINNDGGIFLAGMLPEVQIDKVVSYSMAHGKLNFAIIAPSNQYGKTVNDVLKKIVRGRNGNLITSEFYDSSGKDIERVAENIVNSFSLSSRLTDGKNKLKRDVVINESDRSYAQVIVIPESGKTLSKIVDAIKRKNIDERDFQLVGTSQWDDISSLNDTNLFGAWFVAPENEKFRNFERAYYQSFNKFPPRISSIVYDSVAAVVDISNRKKDQVTISMKDFINFNNPPKNGFEGIDGLFRFLPNGLVQRNLAVLKVGSGKFETVEKPVERFLKY
jgi:ABC-type branched-subunit amino acid transport system substrate-binding protein